MLGRHKCRGADCYVMSVNVLAALAAKITNVSIW